MVYKIRNFPLSDDYEKGIVRWISRKTKIDDINGEGIIKITADSVSDGSLSGPIGFYNDIRWWMSNISADEHWYQINFLSYTVYFTGYSLSMSPEHYNKKWKILVSDGDEDWQILDEQEMNEIPSSKTNGFICKYPKKGKILRIVDDGPNHLGLNRLTLGAIDVFGEIKWDFDYSCRNNHDYLLISIFIIPFVIN